MDFSKIIIERAKTSDAKVLTHISKRTFDDDCQKFLSIEAGGPPGYSSEKFTAKMIRVTDFYKVRLEDYTTIGGIIISTKNGRGYIQRMFIDVTYQSKGLGKYVLDYIQTLYPEVEEWELDTPSDNIRTNRFYPKCGFQLFKTKEGFNYYRKLVAKDSH